MHHQELSRRLLVWGSGVSSKARHEAQVFFFAFFASSMTLRTPARQQPLVFEKQ